MLLGVIPLFLAAMHFMNAKESLDRLENDLQFVQQKAYSLEKRQATNIALRSNFREADRFYIDKNLETLVFLEPEIEGLQKIAGNKNFADDENVKKRLDFLTGQGNTMLFTEGVVQSYPTFKEVTETLVHPIEINVSDLQNILSKIEGVEIAGHVPGSNRPQLIILDFKLDKKTLSEKNEVFSLSLKLLKREFL
jgi:hypothetical protein